MEKPLVVLRPCICRIILQMPPSGALLMVTGAEEQAVSSLTQQVFKQGFPEHEIKELSQGVPMLLGRCGW